MSTYLVLNNSSIECKTSVPRSPYLVVNSGAYLPLTTSITNNKTLRGDNKSTYQIVEEEVITTTTTQTTTSSHTTSLYYSGIDFIPIGSPILTSLVSMQYTSSVSRPYRGQYTTQRDSRVTADLINSADKQRILSAIPNMYNSPFDVILRRGTGAFWAISITTDYLNYYLNNHANNSSFNRFASLMSSDEVYYLAPNDSNNLAVFSYNSYITSNIAVAGQYTTSSYTYEYSAEFYSSYIRTTIYNTTPDRTCRSQSSGTMTETITETVTSTFIQ